MRESQLEADFAALIKLYDLPTPQREYAFGEHRGPKGRVAKWRFDFYWSVTPRGPLAVEIEGGTWVRGRHSRGRGMTSDSRKYNAAALMGITVLRFTSDMVKSFEAIRTLKEALTCA